MELMQFISTETAETLKSGGYLVMFGLMILE